MNLNTCSIAKSIKLTAYVAVILICAVSEIKARLAKRREMMFVREVMSQSHPAGAGR